MPFVTGSTPFGIFDADAAFQSDADKIVTWVRKKLGEPEISVELSSSHVYQCFEEACLDYSALVNSYQAKSVMTSLLGTATGTLAGSENLYPHQTLEMQRRLAEPYGDEVGVGGSYTLYSGSFITVLGQQNYDLQQLINPTGSDGRSRRMRVKDVFHYSPLSAYRFFGTTSAINYLNNQFSFESFTPETIFYLLPIWEDVLRGMQFKMSNTIRRSQFSYEIHNNVLTLYPSPSDERQIWIRYALDKDPYDPDFDDAERSGVSNLSNVPFGEIQYSKLNSISRQWIRKMTFALSKEILGQIRGKFATVPIPNGDVTLNGTELISEGREEQDKLREELKEMLDELTYDKLAQKEAEKAAALEESIKRVPMLIYTG